jgi:hypothetical protein
MNFVQDFYTNFLKYPTGGVWSNIIANLVWLVPTVLFSRKAWKRHKKKQHEMHEDLKKLHEHVKEIHRATAGQTPN